MPICIASLLILFVLVIVPNTCMPAHAETTNISNSPPIRNAALESTPDFQQGEYVRLSTCLEKKGDTWVVWTETSEDNVDPKRPTRFKWVAPRKVKTALKWVPSSKMNAEGWCYRRAGEEPVFEDGVAMKGTECYRVGGNMWHAFFSGFGKKQREVKLFGTELEGRDYRNHLGRCYYVKNVDEQKKVWKEQKASIKAEKAKSKPGVGFQSQGRGQPKGKEVVRPVPG